MYPQFDETTDTAVIAFRRLLRSALSLKRVIKPLLTENGLTGAQFHTLLRIPADGIPLTKLAAKSWADPGNASGVVDRMEREGLVTRQASADDRRVVLVHTTAEGRRRVAKLWPQYVARIREVMAGLDENKLRQLSTLLDQLALWDGAANRGAGGGGSTAPAPDRAATPAAAATATATGGQLTR